FHLLRLRRPISRRTALHHVADVDVAPQQVDALLFRGALDHLRQALPRASYERNPLLVLVRPWTFADEHQRCLLVPHAENDLVASLAQLAAAAIANVLGDSRERIALGRKGGDGS